MQRRESDCLPTDYDEYASTYRWARRAVKWVLQPLAESVAALPPSVAVLEIGCGTGNYICALCQSRPDLSYFGFDVSQPMLEQAHSRGASVTFVHGDAAKRFPFPDRRFNLAFAIDVIHHVDNLERFFDEAYRVLGTGAQLVIVTDSEATFRRRSLTRFFPEILPIELKRYPSLEVLRDEARRAGFGVGAHEEVLGQIPLDEEFLIRLEAKCSSAMRLLANEAHAAGMVRVRAAAARGERWLSCYDVLRFERSKIERT